MTTAQKKTQGASKARAADKNGTVPNRRQRVQSAEVGLNVLTALTDLGGAASLTTLANHLGENPAKVHRYLASLIETNFVYQDESSSRYVLGPQSITVGLAALRQSDALTMSAAELPALAARLLVSCFVACMGSHGPTIVRWEEPMQPVVVNVKVGSVLPILWSATGRAFGAFMTTPLIDKLITQELAAATDKQLKLLHDRNAVDALFKRFRRSQVAWVNDVLLHNVSSLAAPVFDMNGTVVAVITCLGMTGDFDTSPDGDSATMIKVAAARVSHKLGWQSAN